MTTQTTPRDYEEAPAVFCTQDGGELALVTVDGEPCEHPRRPGFYMVRCDAGHTGGVDATKNPGILDKLARVEAAPQRITLVPMHPGHAQLGLRR
jgi:hypothetical protein